MQNLKHLLGDAHTMIGKLVFKAKQLATLQDILSAQLPDDLQPHCLVSHIDNGVIHMVASKSSWATRLRFEVGALLSALRQTPDWCHIKSIQVKVSPERIVQLQASVPTEPAAQQAQSHPWDIPAGAQPHLRSLYLEETDPKLKKALEKLLNRVDDKAADDNNT